VKGMLLNPNKAGKLALIAVENPQRNVVKRGFGTESRLPILKHPCGFASKKN